MFIYLINAVGTDKYKIGLSKDPKKRVEALQTGNGEELKLIHTFETKYGFTLETALHNTFKTKQSIGEWFQFSDKDIEEFKTRCVLTENNFDSLKESGNFHFLKKINAGRKHS